MLLALSMLVGAGSALCAPQDPAPRELALEGRRLLDAGDLPAAWEALRRAREGLGASARHQPELSDHLALSFYNLAVRLNNQKDPDGALEAFIELLGLAGAAPRLADKEFRARSLDAVVGVTSWLVAAGRPARALVACSAVEQLAPSDPRGPLGVGEAAFAAGDLDAAEAAFRRAGDLAPDRAEPRAGEARVAMARAARLESGDSAGIDWAGLEALLERAVDGFEAARSKATSVESSRRDLARARLALSRARLRRGDVAGAWEQTDEAEKELRAALSEHPDSPWSALDLAGLLFRRRRFDEAVALYQRAGDRLDAMLAATPADSNAPSWRKAALSCRESAAAGSYNLAVDALNRANFDEAERHLAAACPESGLQELCDRFRAAAATRRAAFEASVASFTEALSRESESAAALLALGDLYARVGWWDRARESYERLLALAPATPDLADRLAAVAPVASTRMKPERIELPGGRVTLHHAREQVDPELVTAVKASWLRVASSLGDRAMRGQLTLTVHPNQRAFRERSGPRVGSLVRGHYADGRIAVYDAPSHGAVTWVSVLTHEMAHHAVERLSGGACPRWLSEGLARWVEGDSSILDRARVRKRLTGAGIPGLGELDERLDRAWNDPETYLDWRDASLLAVEEMARHGGTGAMIRALEAMAASRGNGPERAIASAIGIPLGEIDAAWRARLTAGAP